MSNFLNRDFGANTRAFIEANFMTALRLPKVEEPRATFNLNRHRIGGNEEVVTLDLWRPDSGEMPIFAYWVPQGGSCEIPARPTIAIYVFTPDFSGCSLMIDQVNANTYRVYHVQGGSDYMQKEYLSSSFDHGLGLAGSMIFSDYGTGAQPRGFAFLKYEDGRWWIYYQSQTGFGLSYNAGTSSFIPMGTQSVRGGGKRAVADLTVERAQADTVTCAGDLAVAYSKYPSGQGHTVPDAETW